MIFPQELPRRTPLARRRLAWLTLLFCVAIFSFELWDMRGHSASHSDRRNLLVVSMLILNSLDAAFSWPRWAGFAIRFAADICVSLGFYWVLYGMFRS